MAIFDRFRRNRQQSVLPDEVKQYYQTENRQRRGMAIVLALGALLATVALAAALFFGGRFVYNLINSEDTETTQQTNENRDDENRDEANQPGEDENSAGQTPENNDENASPSPSPAPTPTPAPGDETPRSTPPSPESPAPSPQATPNLGDSPLPHTGDEGM